MVTSTNTRVPLDGYSVSLHSSTQTVDSAYPAMFLDEHLDLNDEREQKTHTKTY